MLVYSLVTASVTVTEYRGIINLKKQRIILSHSLSRYSVSQKGRLGMARTQVAGYVVSAVRKYRVRDVDSQSFLLFIQRRTPSTCRAEFLTSINLI